jgi:hypothetical protein
MFTRVVLDAELVVAFIDASILVPMKPSRAKDQGVTWTHLDLFMVQHRLDIVKCDPAARDHVDWTTDYLNVVPEVD